MIKHSDWIAELLIICSRDKEKKRFDRCVGVFNAFWMSFVFCMRHISRPSEVDVCRCRKISPWVRFVHLQGFHAVVVAALVDAIGQKN